MTNLSGYLGGSAKLKLRPEYIEKFVEANNTFLHQLVFDPIFRKVCPLNPWPSGKSAKDFPYAGKMLEPEIAFDLAAGNLDTQTLKPFNENKWIPKELPNSVWSQKYKLPPTPPRKSHGTIAKITTSATTKKVIANWGNSQVAVSTCNSTLLTSSEHSRKRKSTTGVFEYEKSTKVMEKHHFETSTESFSTIEAVVIEDSDPEENSQETIKLSPSSPSILSQTNSSIRRSLLRNGDTSSTSYKSAEEFDPVAVSQFSSQSQLSNVCCATSPYFDKVAINPNVSPSNKSEGTLVSKLEDLYDKTFLNLAKENQVQTSQIQQENETLSIEKRSRVDGGGAINLLLAKYKNKSTAASSN